VIKNEKKNTLTLTKLEKF